MCGRSPVIIQVDAGASNSRGAAFVVCHDFYGNYLRSSSLVIFGMHAANTLETIVCHEGLALAEDLGLHNFVVASYPKKVVNDLANGSRGRNGVIIGDIKSRATSFNCHFSFEPHLGNEDAHNLARFSLYLGQGRHMWVMQPHDPNVIPQTVIFDE